MTKLPSFFMESTRTWFEKTLGQPTLVQTESWPHISAGEHTLAAAPTGTGKTLTAFLVFLDALIAKSIEGTLQEQLELIYISPLKSLATDIRENLKRPMDGIYQEENKKRPELTNRVRVAIRTGDTTQKERRDMIKHPPHILITTPESLYLMLTSQTGRKILGSAKAIILDELHAMIDTKRGAHLMLSLARLDVLCEKPLQRIGLSATIEPLSTAAEYLSPDPVSIVAPNLKKSVVIRVVSPRKDEFRIEKDSVWRDIATRIYEECQGSRSVLTFVQGRKAAEQLAMYMRELGGEDFARVHHGSLSKTQRSIVEQDLKQGRIRLLIATSSMELGIDVGEIDRVFQVGLPPTIAGTMQRLGRAGHRPDQTSEMLIYPRTAQEALYCGLTAQVARDGGIEHSKPPRKCLDVLAQHLVSMAANREYQVEELLPILHRAKPFDDVTIEEIREILKMLAGDYEHEDNIPVRPRLLYDRIHDHVEGDSYSRMLAVAAGGTIPDRGMFSVKTEAGVKVGEVEEEFVFESRVGDEFQLGSFHWRVQKITKDTVFVIPSSSKRDRLPFWKGDMVGRNLMTGIAFGKILKQLEQAYQEEELPEALAELGLDEECCEDAGGYLERQIQATEVLPGDQTIIVEHYRDEDGNYQLMVHSVFGNCVNAPLALLLEYTASEETKATINYVSDDDGIVLFSFDGLQLPDGLIYRIDPTKVKELLEILAPTTTTFNIMFRYNAGRSLMMGISRLKRQPLWIQRIKGSQMLERAISYEEHPLIQETKRECLEDYWDMDGLISILEQIHAGSIEVREIFTEIPSPMSFLLRKKTEESLMYDYAPSTAGVSRVTDRKLQEMKDLLTPDRYELEKVQARAKLPEDEKQLHSLLMIEGDLQANEIQIPVEWLKSLMKKEQVKCIEPGLFIAAEHEQLYENALEAQEKSALAKVILRLIRYKGGQTIEDIAERYFDLADDETISLLTEILMEQTKAEVLVCQEDVYYYKELYDRARTATVKSRRALIQTQDFSGFASYLVNAMSITAPPAEQLEYAIERLCGLYYSAELWESVLLPARVTTYRPELLDLLLTQGKYYWKMNGKGELCFLRYEDADWERTPLDKEMTLKSQNPSAFVTETTYEALAKDNGITSCKRKILETLQKRGACFTTVLEQALSGQSAKDALLELMQEGSICADSFGPVRYLLNQSKIEKMPSRQQVLAKMRNLSAGRWDYSRKMCVIPMELQVDRALQNCGILCRETAKELIASDALMSWHDALDVLCIREYVNQVKRGYFVNGMSGIQYIAENNEKRIVNELQHPRKECHWICAIDPAQPWGKLTMHMEGRSFINVVGTYAALYEGRVVGTCEHKGKALRIFEPNLTEEIVKTLAYVFLHKRILTDTKRMVLREYPKEAADALHQNGFKHEIQDYVLYR